MVFFILILLYIKAFLKEYRCKYNFLFGAKHKLVGVLGRSRIRSERQRRVHGDTKTEYYFVLKCTWLHVYVRIYVNLYLMLMIMMMMRSLLVHKTIKCSKGIQKIYIECVPLCTFMYCFTTLI